MPFPNFHAARLKNPNLFDDKSYRTTPGGLLYGSINVPKTINIIWGKYKGKTAPSDPPIPQSLRFKKDVWSVQQAKQWLKTNKITYIRFEPAKDVNASRKVLEFLLNFKRSIKWLKS